MSSTTSKLKRSKNIEVTFPFQQKKWPDRSSTILVARKYKHYQIEINTKPFPTPTMFYVIYVLFYKRSLNHILQFLPSSGTVQSKSSPVGTEISFKFDYYHPHPSGKVEMQLEIDHVWTVGNWWIVSLVIFGCQGVGWSGTAQKIPTLPGKVYHKVEIG